MLTFTCCQDGWTVDYIGYISDSRIEEVFRRRIKQFLRQHAKPGCVVKLEITGYHIEVVD